ncbi:MAG: sigma 54-interacting transcriptional regulator [Pirellulaceae bacterium]|nr:sigma 54-interacting transcriptional regulator [Pirellulaceae bacterium]
MSDIHQLLLEVWREISRQLELADSVKTISRLLAERCKLQAIRLDRFSEDGHRLETVACETVMGSPLPALITTLNDDETLVVQQLLQGQECLIGNKPDDFRQLSRIVVPEPSLTTLLCPLPSGQSVAGLAVMVLSDEADLRTWRRLLRELCEPLAVALANDLRLHELKVLREAADADRRILLERLGRHQIHDEIVGANRGLKNVMERVELVAKSDMPVLILGETGTGKEVISRAIHQRSQRASGPFVRVNCGAIPSELIDSQLFGHEKGSFTGAMEQHQGWFERADGGTLFLDEIGELPLAAQVRLLRVLQDHQIERVGGKSTIHVDVRIVAATHRDLSNMVRERTFREDLWYRINVFPIFLPRLRDRVEDLPMLVKHLALRASARFGLPAVVPSPEDLLAMANYHWPGNVRELGAVIDRAVILGRGTHLDIAGALGLSIQSQPEVDSGPTFYEVIPESHETLQSRKARVVNAPIANLDEAMRQHIQKALTVCRGRIEGELGAAKILGINPHTLRARMRKLDIDWNSFR